jgi:ubiquinone/menaquinone biosynthesis C-methylase UbiE
MTNNSAELIEKIRQQFDRGPYPRVPLEKSAKDSQSRLYFHNIVTAYYRRNRQIITAADKLILDAACGTGYTTLTLAEANPGARIVGIDISAPSIDLARQRLDYHGFGDRVEFHALPLEELPTLGLQFDYINADEVLYLLPDMVAGLAAFKTVLKPAGIIRTNLHSAFQRHSFYRAQSVFRMMGLMDENPGEMEIEIVRDFFKALKPGVDLKQKTWEPKKEENEECFLSNYLLQGDKGSTVPEMLALLDAAGLEFIGMVEWQKWDLMQLFTEPDNLPVSIALILSEMSLEDELALYQTIQPNLRLLDFWCGNLQEDCENIAPEDWSIADWKNVTVHLHPQLKTPALQEALAKAIELMQTFEISKYLPITLQENLMDISFAACLLPPLLESPQPIQALVQRWRQIHPIDFTTLEPITEVKAWEMIREISTFYENIGYFLLER